MTQYVALLTFVTFLFLPSISNSNPITLESVVEKLSVFDIRLSSSAEEIQTSVNNLKSLGWKCTEKKLEETALRRFISARMYSWSCNMQTSDKPMNYEKFDVNFTNNQVVKIEYGGTRGAKIGDIDLTELLVNLDKTVSTLKDRPSTYTYSDFQRVLGASGDIKTQHLKLTTEKTCTIIGSEKDLNYTVKVEGGQRQIASQNYHMASITLDRTGLNNCIQRLPLK